MERVDGIKEHRGRNRLPDAVEKWFHWRMVALKEFGHPLRAGNVFFSATVMNGSGNHKSHAADPGRAECGNCRRSHKETRRPERGGGSASHQPARSCGRALDDAAAGEGKSRRINGRIPQVKSRNRLAIGFAHEDEIRFARTAIESLGDFQHGINFQGPAIQRDSRRSITTTASASGGPDKSRKSSICVSIMHRHL